MKMTEKKSLYNLETGQPYPVEKIAAPIAVFHGEADSIADATSLEQVI